MFIYIYTYICKIRCVNQIFSKSSSPPNWKHKRAIQLNIYVHVSLYICIYMFWVCIPTIYWMHVYNHGNYGKYKYIYKYIHIYVYTYTYMYIQMHIYRYIHTYICIYIYIYMHMYTYICKIRSLHQIFSKESSPPKWQFKIAIKRTVYVCASLYIRTYIRTYMCFEFACISCMYWMHVYHYRDYGVATISRLLKIIGLFCKRDL